MVLPSGKGADFFEFIGGELLPYIEKKYRTAPFRIIAGHDTTAGFLNFFLYKDNPLFNAYISLSPELAPEMENQNSGKSCRIQNNLFFIINHQPDGDIKQLRRTNKKVRQQHKTS